MCLRASPRSYTLPPLSRLKIGCRYANCGLPPQLHAATAIAAISRQERMSTKCPKSLGAEKWSSQRDAVLFEISTLTSATTDETTIDDLAHSGE